MCGIKFFAILASDVILYNRWRFNRPWIKLKNDTFFLLLEQWILPELIPANFISDDIVFGCVRGCYCRFELMMFVIMQRNCNSQSANCASFIYYPTKFKIEWTTCTDAISCCDCCRITTSVTHHFGRISNNRRNCLLFSSSRKRSCLCDRKFVANPITCCK